MAYRTIKVKSNQLEMEGIGSGVIKPGHLLERTSAAAATVKVHATAGGVAQRLFAVENDLYGKEIGDSYSAADKVFFINALPGDQINALIANGESIAIGDKLISAGDGTLKEHTTDSSGVAVEEDVVAYALEACDMSDSSAADPSGRCLIEVR